MKNLFFIITLFIGLIAKAQMPGMGGMGKGMKDPKLGRVFGKVLDASTGKPVEYASVQVLWFSKDSLLGGGLVKENGDFAVEGLPSFGQVRVRVKFVGYKDYNQKVYIVPPDKVDQDLGNIKLALDDKLLSEVDVVAEKSAVVLSIDKRTYNVEKDLSVKGGTAVDVMKNIPGDRYGGMANINVKQGKWNTSLMYSYNQAINNTEGFTKRTQLDSGVTIGHYNQNNVTQMGTLFNFGRLGIDYNIDNRNTISLNGMIVAGQFNTNDKQNYDGDFLNLPIPINISGDQTNKQKAAFQNYNGQLLYKKTFPKIGKELTVDGNYNFTTSKNGYVFATNTIFNALGQDSISPTAYQKNVGSTTANQFVFQMDYVNPISETKKFEAGIKAFYKNSISSNNTSRASGNEYSYQKDSVMSNRYVIDDMVNAAYVNYSAKTFWDIGYQAGLRFEQSYYAGNITDQNKKFSYNYPSTSDDILKSLFPAIYFSKKLKKSQEVQLNFSRKIQRPNFFQLMPFIMFADKQNYRIGNPELKPEFKNIAEANYNKIFSKGSYLASGYFRYEEQPITDVAYPDPDPAKTNVLVNTSINGDNAIRYGFENTFKWTFFKNLDWTVNANAYYIYIKGKVVPTEPEVKAEGYAWNAKTTLSYKFPKNITLQVNGNYESPKILLLGVANEIYSIDVSLNYMYKTKWIFNATVSDIFNTRRMGTHFETPYYNQDLSRRRESRYFRFTITYLFGKMDASIFKRGKQMKGMGGQEGNQDGLDFK